jgi:uncharacterized protein YegP (UPF0339 family)
MIHICRSAKTKQFYVVTLAKNGEVLSTSELLKSKSACLKNILSQMDAFSCITVHFQDDTLKKPLLYNLFGDKSKSVSKFPPHPIYTPSKK